jgi:phosphoribosylglycinamide formyltransferase-1
MKKLAVFVSGSGTNMEHIARYFAGSNETRVGLVVCNKHGVGAIERAQRMGIPLHMITRDDLEQPSRIIRILRHNQIDFIVLAGFLWLLPEALIKEFSGRIVNIHPALLPAYGGKGMFGMRVHQAVVAAGEKFSGITIHYVDEQYDRGAIIFQAIIALRPDETPESLAERIHALEYEHYPRVIENLIRAL